MEAGERLKAPDLGQSAGVAQIAKPSSVAAHAQDAVVTETAKAAGAAWVQVRLAREEIEHMRAPCIVCGDEELTEG